MTSNRAAQFQSTSPTQVEEIGVNEVSWNIYRGEKDQPPAAASKIYNKHSYSESDVKNFNDEEESCDINYESPIKKPKIVKSVTVPADFTRSLRVQLEQPNNLSKDVSTILSNNRQISAFIEAHENDVKKNFIIEIIS